MEPLFSIIIPVYNAENYLEECVNSVLSQAYVGKPMMEIILVDDGSTDNSGDLCDKYADKHENIRVVHQNNQGLLAARRTGYKIACGKYIVNLDSDDKITDNAISSLVDEIRASDADILFFNISTLDTNGIRSYYKNVFTKDTGCWITKEQVLEAYFNYDIPVVTSMAGKAFKRACLDMDYDYSKFGKLSMGEDTLQTAEVVSRASNFYYLNKNLYIYRMESGMTARYDPMYYDTFKLIIMEVRNRPGFAEDEKYRVIFNEKIISSACRAITQSKASNMGYHQRKQFIKSIFEDSILKKALSELDLKSANIKKRYKVIIQMVNIHAYLALHLMLCVLS